MKYEYVYDDLLNGINFWFYAHYDMEKLLNNNDMLENLLYVTMNKSSIKFITILMKFISMQ